MQDEERLREGVELALDNRQIFLLFATSAVVLSLVFAFGVVVGKRLSPVVAAQPKTDPLSMLDRAGAGASDDELTFPQALAGSGAGKADVKKEAAPAKAEPAAPQDKVSPAAPIPAPAIPTRPEPQKAPAKPAQRLAAEPSAPTPAPVAAADAAKGKGKESGKVKVAKAAKGKADKSKENAGGYTLQLSSFQDRHEAERFMTDLRKKGHEPTMVPTRIPNRGLWYRVRLGSYGSWKEALSAKQSFETSTKLIAYVARR